MPQTKRRELYMAACLDDLDKKYDVPDLKEKRVKMLCSGAQKLFESAEEAKLKGDEECSYVYYMKYLSVIKQVQEAPDYAKEKKHIMEVIKKDPIKALEQATILKDSLKSRYEAVQRLMDVEEQSKIIEKIEADRQRAKEAQLRAATKTPNSLPNENDISIKCFNLYGLLKDGSRKILVLDARPAEDFKQSRMSCDQCISIPEERIIAGLTASKLEKALPAESMWLWSQRQKMQLIVLMDWSSHEIVSGKTLHTLKTILLKWDPDNIYERHPVILEGGFEEWLLRYPSLTTNPHVSPPNHNTTLNDFLSGIDYPNLSDSISPNDVEDMDTRNVFNKSYMSNHRQNFNNFNPAVDRSSKAAALQTYEENSKAMRVIYEEQEKLVDTSLNIERQRLKAEENWETVRKKSEEEAREELKASFQLKEQEIISELMQLENKQRDTEMENQQLREQLEMYKRREREEAARRSKTQELSPTDNQNQTITHDYPTPESSFRSESAAQAEAHRLAQEAEAHELSIKAKEREKELLDRKRELLQAEREKKLAEARENKKLLQKKEMEENEKYTLSLKNDESSSADNRSYSFPNITQVGDEDVAMKGKTPQFDRTTKPSKPPMDVYMIPPRDFQGVYGCEGRGLTGLKNLGNTCYMNSILQCLNNTSHLVNYFCQGLYRQHVKQGRGEAGGGTQGAVAQEVAQVVQALWSGQYRFISTRDFKNVVGRHWSMFRGVEQQDSHEFLTILMDWLHDDLQIPSRQQIHLDSLPPSEKAWQEYTKSKESLILKLFYGQIKSTVKCMVCGKESITYDSFSNLSLELPGNANKCSLGDCLEHYLSDERILGWNCPSCKDKREAVKKLDISRLPPVLVIHFKRFYVDAKEYISNTYKKKQTYIDFPLQNLDMGHFSLQPERKNTVYNLYGVSNHYGSMEEGHYTAYCKSHVFSKWFKFDDHMVTEISPSDVKSSAAYILFYTSLPDSALHR